MNVNGKIFTAVKLKALSDVTIGKAECWEEGDILACVHGLTHIWHPFSEMKQSAIQLCEVVGLCYVQIIRTVLRKQLGVKLYLK